MAATFDFPDVAEAADAISDWVVLNQGNLPDHLHHRLKALTRMGTSPVDLIAGFVKAVYANRDEPGISDQAMKIAAAAADLIDMKGFHGRLDDRAGQMALALQRDAGVNPPKGKAWPKPEKDPEPDAEFEKPQEPEPLPEPAAPDVEVVPAPEPIIVEPVNVVVADPPIVVVSE